MHGLRSHTGKTAGVPVGDAFLGRVVDALGRPIDGGDAIPADGYRPVEEPAPGIIDRQSVDTPMETGLLSIDAMFPIGRGQRELSQYTPLKLNDPTWYASLRGVSGSVNIIIFNKS